MKLILSKLSIYYEVQGKGDDIILLHGWGTDSGNVRDISTFLKEKTNSRVFSLDLPGFGFSDSPEDSWNVDDYVELVLSFIDKMNLSKISLLGHSFGGRIAIKLAANHPDYINRLILVDSAGIKPKRTTAYYFKVGMAKCIKMLKICFPQLNNAAFLNLAYSRIGSEDYQRADSLRGTFVKVVNEDLKPFLPRIENQTLLIWGENDKSVPVSDAREMKNLIPNSTLKIIKQAGHFPFLDNFQDFSTVLLDFWRN